jgi:hypothetical protein
MQQGSGFTTISSQVGDVQFTAQRTGRPNYRSRPAAELRTGLVAYSGAEHRRTGRSVRA